MKKGLIVFSLSLSAYSVVIDKAAEARAAKEASDSIMRAFEKVDKNLKTVDGKLKKSNDTLLNSLVRKLDSLNK